MIGIKKQHCILEDEAKRHRFYIYTWGEKKGKMYIAFWDPIQSNPIKMERFTLLEYRIRYGAADRDTEKRERERERDGWSDVKRWQYEEGGNGGYLVRWLELCKQNRTDVRWWAGIECGGLYAKKRGNSQVFLFFQSLTLVVSFQISRDFLCELSFFF
jgi:hypothetical protein